MKRQALVASVVAFLAWPSPLSGDKPAPRKEIAHELSRLHRVNDRLMSALGREVPNPVRALARIAACESGSRPTAVSPGGRYRGMFQFDLSTWRGVGGTGDPARASEAEQWGRALLLYARRGSQPWPVCGR